MAYPFSRTSRVEFSSSATPHRVQRRDRRTDYYDYGTRASFSATIEDLDTGEPIHLYDVRAAFVRDSVDVRRDEPGRSASGFRAEVAPTDRRSAR